MTKNSPAAWNTAFANWLESHPSEAELLRAKIGSDRVKDYETGRISTIEALNPYTRAVLYKTTGIEELNFPTYFDPDTVNGRAIVEGTQSRKALPIWLGSHKMTREGLARDAKVDKKTVQNFIEGNPIRGAGGDKILRQVRAYVSRYEPQTPHPVTPSTESHPLELQQQPEQTRASSTGLDDLTLRVASLHEDLKALGGKINPTEATWRNRGEYAVNLLAQVMDHYASASPDERRAFTDYIKKQDLVQVFGWSANILSGLVKDDSSPEVFARHFRPNNLGRKN